MKFTEGWDGFSTGVVAGYLVYLMIARPVVYSHFINSGWSETLFNLTLIGCIAIGAKLGLVEWKR